MALTTTLESSCTAAAAGESQYAVAGQTTVLDFFDYFEGADFFYSGEPRNSSCVEISLPSWCGDLPNKPDHELTLTPGSADIGDIFIFTIEAWEPDWASSLRGRIKIEIVESLPSSTSNPGPSGGVMMGGYSL